MVPWLFRATFFTPALSVVKWYHCGYKKVWDGTEVQMSQSRRYCFTLNNYTVEEYNGITGASGDNLVRFIIVGKETGQSGTPHLQGYVEFTRPVRINRVKTLLGTQRVHLEAARGSAESNIDYCSKEDNDPYQSGEPGRQSQGRRTDLLAVQATLDQGGTMRDVAEAHFGTFLRMHKGISLYIELRTVPRDWRTQVVYVWGPTGSGKSRFVHADSQKLCPQSVCWLPDQSLKWFDGYYGGTKGVVLDDFDGTAPITLLLRLFDRYPMKVPVKGGFQEWNPRIVWITSNYSLEHWYGNHGEHYNALLRRFDDIQYMG